MFVCLFVCSFILMSSKRLDIPMFISLICLVYLFCLFIVFIHLFLHFVYVFMHWWSCTPWSRLERVCMFIYLFIHSFTCLCVYACVLMHTMEQAGACLRGIQDLRSACRKLRNCPLSTTHRCLGFRV